MMRNLTKILLLIASFLFMISLTYNAHGSIDDLVLADGSNRYFLPLFINNRQPMASTSYYLTTVDPNFLHGLGCELGSRDQNLPGAQDSVVVLNFSYPICFNEGHFGADLYGYGPATMNHIKTAVQAFTSGYYTCTGTDDASNLVVGVGTNNKSSVTPSSVPLSPYTCDGTEKANAHGAAWSGMVSEINQWLIQTGMFHQVQAYGASDIELGWNTPTWSRAWVDGFSQAGENFLLHFGDAAGCPYEDNPHWSCGTSNFRAWTMEDVWYVSWGAPSSLPLPLIYLTNGVHAKQWAYLSQYSVSQHGHRMDFTGVFTQEQFCQQFNWPICERTNNSPEQAYEQLMTELNKHAATAQNIRWKTDIRWIMQSELTQEPGQTDTSLSSIQVSDQDDPFSAYLMNLDNTVLSSAMQSSLLMKQTIRDNFAYQIEISRTNPADKHGRIILP